MVKPIVKPIIQPLLVAFIALAPKFVTAQNFDTPNAIGNGKLVLAGEMHFFTPIATYEYLFDQFSRNAEGKSCLAVEFPKSDATFEDFLQSLHARSELIKKDPHPMAKEVSKNLAMTVSYYGQIATLAKAKGLKVVGVEHPEKMNNAFSIDQRNQYIGGNLRQLIDSGECLRIFGIFGKVHLSLGMMRSTRIQDFLGGISPTTINLQLTNEEAIEPAYRSFSESHALADSDKFVWLDNKLLKKDAFLLPFIPGELSLWQHFDFTVLTPKSLKPESYAD